MLLASGLSIFYLFGSKYMFIVLLATPFVSFSNTVSSFFPIWISHPSSISSKVPSELHCLWYGWQSSLLSQGNVLLLLLIWVFHTPLLPWSWKDQVSTHSLWKYVQKPPFIFIQIHFTPCWMLWILQFFLGLPTVHGYDLQCFFLPGWCYLSLQQPSQQPWRYCAIDYHCLTLCNFPKTVGGIFQKLGA